MKSPFRHGAQGGTYSHVERFESTPFIQLWHAIPQQNVLERGRTQASNVEERVETWRNVEEGRNGLIAAQLSGTGKRGRGTWGNVSQNVAERKVWMAGRRLCLFASSFLSFFLSFPPVCSISCVTLRKRTPGVWRQAISRNQKESVKKT